MPDSRWHHIKSAAFKLGLKLIPAKKGLTFLTLHHLEDCEFEWLGNILDYLKKEHDFIDVSDIDQGDFINCESNNKGIVLTFDDAFKCHRKIADSLLAPRDIKALFFVPTEFIGLTGSDAFEFTKHKFFPNSSPKNLEKGSYDAMDWDDLQSLVKLGHTIGAHTRSHPVLSSISETQLYSEISEPANFLEEKLNIEISHFAYPFGSIESVNTLAFIEAKKRFKWAYSNIRGMSKDSPCRHFIYRQNILPKSPIWLVDAIVKGRLDIKYKKVHSRTSKKYLANVDA